MILRYKINQAEDKTREWLLSMEYKKHADPDKEAKVVKKYYCYYLEE